jgi:hypothetical protein
VGKVADAILTGGNVLAGVDASVEETLGQGPTICFSIRRCGGLSLPDK